MRTRVYWDAYNSRTPVKFLKMYFLDPKCDFFRRQENLTIFKRLLLNGFVSDWGSPKALLTTSWRQWAALDLYMAVMLNEEQPTFITEYKPRQAACGESNRMFFLRRWRTILSKEGRRYCQWELSVMAVEVSHIVIKSLKISEVTLSNFHGADWHLRRNVTTEDQMY